MAVPTLAPHVRDPADKRDFGARVEGDRGDDGDDVDSLRARARKRARAAA